MKVIILIAGKGTRLKPLTDYAPKCLLPVAGVPLLEIWIRILERAGVAKLLLNPCPGTTFLKEWLLRAKPRNMTITLRPEKEPIGTAQTLLRNRDWVGFDDFLVIYGDVLTNIDIMLLRSIHESHGAIITMQTYVTDTPSEKGIISVDDEGWATDFVEKPDNSESLLAFSGIFFAKAEFIDEIGEKDVDLGLNVLPKVIKSGKTWLTYHDPSVYFRDIGTIPDYLICQTEWRKLNDMATSQGMG